MTTGIRPLGSHPIGHELYWPAAGGGVVSLVGANAQHAAVSGTGQVVQVHLLAGAPTAQAAASGSGAIAVGAVISLAGAPCLQDATSTGSGKSAQISQTHVLAGSSAGQSALSAAGAVAQAHQLVGAGAAQAAASGTGAVAQTHALAGAPSLQAATSPGGAISQGAVIALSGAACLQGSTSSAGAIAQVHVLVGSPAAQAATSQSAAISQRHQLQAAPGLQLAVSGTGGITLGTFLRSLARTRVPWTGADSSEQQLVGRTTYYLKGQASRLDYTFDLDEYLQAIEDSVVAWSLSPDALLVVHESERQGNRFGAVVSGGADLSTLTLEFTTAGGRSDSFVIALQRLAALPGVLATEVAAPGGFKPASSRLYRVHPDVPMPGLVSERTVVRPTFSHPAASAYDYSLDFGPYLADIGDALQQVEVRSSGAAVNWFRVGGVVTCLVSGVAAPASVTVAIRTAGGREDERDLLLEPLAA